MRILKKGEKLTWTDPEDGYKFMLHPVAGDLEVMYYDTINALAGAAKSQEIPDGLDISDVSIEDAGSFMKAMPRLNEFLDAAVYEVADSSGSSVYTQEGDDKISSRIPSIEDRMRLFDAIMKVNGLSDEDKKK